MDNNDTNIQQSPVQPQIVFEEYDKNRASSAKIIWLALWPALFYLFLQLLASFVVVTPFMFRNISKTFTNSTVDPMDVFSATNGGGISNILGNDFGNMVMISTLASALIASAVLIPIYIIDKKRRAAPYSLAKTGFHNVIFISVASIALNALTTGVVSLIPETTLNEYSELMSSIMDANKWIVVATVVFVGPIVEELIFRGLCLSRLRMRFGNVFALIVSSVLFGAIHGNLVQGLYAALLGLFLGWIYIKTGNLIIPCIAHIVYNASSFILELLLGSTDISVLSVIVVSTLVSAAMIFFLLGYFRKAPIVVKL